MKTEQEIKEFQKRWSYAFESWKERFGALPIGLIDSEDRSESYEMDQAHIFELPGDKYAFVTECGCSCYSRDDADIDIVPLNEAKRLMHEWRKRKL